MLFQEPLAGGLSCQPLPAARRADPAAGLTANLYLEVKQHLLTHDHDAQQMLEWSQRELAPPLDAEKLAAEVIWIILCAGRSAQAAWTIETRVWKALRAGTPVVGAFGYRAKAEAIERAGRRPALSSGPSPSTSWPKISACGQARFASLPPGPASTTPSGCRPASASAAAKPWPRRFRAPPATPCPSWTPSPGSDATRACWK